MAGQPEVPLQRRERRQPVDAVEILDAGVAPAAAIRAAGPGPVGPAQPLRARLVIDAQEVIPVKGRSQHLHRQAAGQHHRGHPLPGARGRSSPADGQVRPQHRRQEQHRHHEHHVARAPAPVAVPEGGAGVEQHHRPDGQQRRPAPVAGPVAQQPGRGRQGDQQRRGVQQQALAGGEEQPPQPHQDALGEQGRARDPGGVADLERRTGADHVVGQEHEREGRAPDAHPAGQRQQRPPAQPPAQRQHHQQRAPRDRQHVKRLGVHQQADPDPQHDRLPPAGRFAQAQQPEEVAQETGRLGDLRIRRAGVDHHQRGEAQSQGPGGGHPRGHAAIETELQEQQAKQRPDAGGPEVAGQRAHQLGGVGAGRGHSPFQRRPRQVDQRRQQRVDGVVAAVAHQAGVQRNAQLAAGDDRFGHAVHLLGVGPGRFPAAQRHVDAEHDQEQAKLLAPGHRSARGRRALEVQAQGQGQLEGVGGHRHGGVVHRQLQRLHPHQRGRQRRLTAAGCGRSPSTARRPAIPAVRSPA